MGQDAGLSDQGAAIKAGRLLFGVGMRTSVVLLALVIGACSTVEVGRNFDVRMFGARVEQGRTTEAQVQDWLGPPSSTGVAVLANGERFSRWLYYYGEGRLPRMNGAHLKMLEIQFDQRGIVRAYNWSE